VNTHDDRPTLDRLPLERAALELLRGARPSKKVAALAGLGEAPALERALTRRWGVTAGELGRLGRSGHYRFTYGGRFHVEETLRYLGRDGENLAEQVTDGVYRRFFPVGERQVAIALTLTRNGCEVDTDPAMTAENKLALHHCLRRFLGLEQPLAGFSRAMKAHPVMGPLVRAFPGVRVPQVPSLWEALCWAVIGQQINLAFAYRLRNRFIALGNGGEIPGGEERDPKGNGEILPFPEPEAILDIPDPAWRPAQFSRQKADYLRGLARTFAEGALSEKHLAGLPDEEAHGALTAIRGLGPWSAAYGLLRALGRVDALPVGDAGLRSALRHHFRLEKMPDAREQEALMEPIRPYRGLGTYYLWKSLGALRQE